MRFYESGLNSTQIKLLISILLVSLGYVLSIKWNYLNEFGLFLPDFSKTVKSVLRHV